MIDIFVLGLIVASVAGAAYAVGVAILWLATLGYRGIYALVAGRGRRDYPEPVSSVAIADAAIDADVWAPDPEWVE